MMGNGPWPLGTEEKFGNKMHPKTNTEQATPVSSLVQCGNIWET